MRRINYKSDIPPLLLSLKVDENQITVPDCDFIVRFYIDGYEGRHYDCSHIGGVWSNCEPSEDGTKLVCYINNQRLGIGELCAEFHYISPDRRYSDGSQKSVVIIGSTELGVELVEDNGDAVTEAAIDVTLPFIYRTAYEIARDHGYTGTAEDFYGALASVVGIAEAEKKRVTAEITRNANEQERIENEENRLNAESDRVNAEAQRVRNEAIRRDAESDRVEQEEDRKAKFKEITGFIATVRANEGNRESNERERQTNEDTRITEEAKRVEAENKRAAEFEQQKLDLSGKIDRSGDEMGGDLIFTDNAGVSFRTSGGGAHTMFNDTDDVAKFTADNGDTFEFKQDETPNKNSSAVVVSKNLYNALDMTLESMGSALDGDAAYRAEAGDKIFNPDTCKIQRYNSTVGGFEDLCDPVEGKLYANKMTGYIYRWDTKTKKMVFVGGVKSYTKDEADIRFAKLDDATQIVKVKDLEANNSVTAKSMWIGDEGLLLGGDGNGHLTVEQDEVITDVTLNEKLATKADDVAYGVEWNNGQPTGEMQETTVKEATKNTTVAALFLAQSYNALEQEVEKKANKTELDTKVSKTDIVQNTGQSTTSVMSQKAVSDSINKLKNAGYLYAGIATPTTNPGTPDGSVFYIANGKGTYTNFGGIDVTEDEVVILYYDTSWHKETTGIASNDKLTKLDKQVRRVRIFCSSFEGSDVWIDSPMSLKKGFSYLIESTAKYERSSNLFLFLSKEKNRQDENIIVSNLIIVPANNTTGIITWTADNDYDTAYIYLYQGGGNEVTLRITELSQQEILAQKLKCGQNVSLIYSTLGKVNIDLSRNVIDFGTDSVLFIAGQYYLVKQTVPLIDSSSAVKLVYDTKTNIPRCIAYNTVLNENEVLIGSYRRYGDSIVNYSFPFEITINGKERWDEQVEAISEIVDKHTEAINSISSDLFKDISITNFVLDSQAFVNEPISLKAGVKYAFTTVLSEKRTGSLYIRLYSEKSTSSVKIVEFVVVRANRYHEVVEYTPQHDITNAYLWFYQSGGNTINLTISLPKKDVGNYNGCIKSINHQGANRLAPANTLPAFRKSKQLGFYAVETDVRFTKDNIPCLLHDATIDATSNGSGSLSSMTFEEVRQYDFSAKFNGGGYKNVKIPSLEEFLDVCKRIAIHPYIEIKEGGDDKLSIIANIVKSKGLDKFVTFICQNDTYLSYISNILPSARLGLLLNFGQISQENINRAKALSNGTNEVFIDAEYYLGGSFIPQDAVDICIANGIPLEVWTLNEIAYIENMPMYISGVTSDSLIAGKVLYDYEIVTY